MTEQRYVSCEWAVIIAMLIAMVPFLSNAQVSTQVEWQRCLGGGDVESGADLTPTSDGGFICIGSGLSSDGDMIGSQGGGDILVTKLNADGTVQWRRVLGGSMLDFGVDCLEAQDGSIVVLGTTMSADGDVTGNNGAEDIWVVKLSAFGTIIWQRTYGGSSTDLSGQIQGTPDGGFVIWGATRSGDGDVTGFHPGIGAEDAWVLKVDSFGTIEWDRALGGSGNDYGGMLLQAADGGFLLCFSSIESGDGDVSNYNGSGDCWLVKLSSAGSIEWSRTIGGSLRESGVAILELNDGDLLLLGQSASSDGDIAVNHGETDVLLAKLSSNGALLWERTYGGSLLDYSSGLLRTADGGCVLVGSSSSSDVDLTTNQGGMDAWLMKVDESGTLQWQRSFGGSQADLATLIEADGDGYVISGQTFSNNGDVVGSHGGNELWFFKVTANGELLWQRSLGGSASETGVLRGRSSDGGYVFFGQTTSNDGDVSGNHGQQDMWVVKLRVSEPAEPVEPLECALFVPNAFSPNNSTKNDAHCIYGTDCVTSMSFNIYDRWGNKVFASADPKACWDGTYNGQALDPAVFVYHLRATLANEEVVEKQGNITLMR